MPSIFTHALVAGALGTAFQRHGLPPRFWILGATCAMLPDADVIGLPLGIPFRGPLGHRGLSHSFLAAVLVSLVAAWLCARRPTQGISYRALWLYCFLATASHGLLDAMTDGGIGVAFLAPFSDERYFFPFRPIAVSPIGIRPFFSGRGVEVLASELTWVWLPCLLFATACWWLRRTARSGSFRSRLR